MSFSSISGIPKNDDGEQSMNKTPSSSRRRAICGICPAGCWVSVSYDDQGRLKDVTPDSVSPHGAICKLGEHSAEIVYSPDRLQRPLRRKGPKGTYEFFPISWENAYEEIVTRLNFIKAQSGPEATAIYTGRGSFELAMCDLLQPKGAAVSSASSILFPFGSPNTLGVGALCYVSFAMIAPHVTCGGMLINMFSDMENAEIIVVWGANPATDSPPVDLERIKKARARGAEVIVIDPRRTHTAKVTEAEWIPIRPGTDGALALGMINVLIEEELFDEPFARNWTHGFDDLARYVQHFRPATVESITGIPADAVLRLARRIAGARGASPIMYTGLEYSNSGVQAIRAVLTLWALAGQLDVPGGRMFSMPENIWPIDRSGLVDNPDIGKALGRDRFPIYSMYRGESHAIALPESVLDGKPYRIRSLIIVGGSVITSWPQSIIWKETLSALDFLVCVDRWLTADAAYADIVLPATTYYEINSYMTYGPTFRLREKIVEPIGEARNDFLILAELAERLGYGHLYPQTEEEIIEHALKGSGYTLEQVRRAGGEVTRPVAPLQYKKWEKGLLRPFGAPGFDTPTGKFEIHSTTLEEHGYDPLPVYTEPKEGPLTVGAQAIDRFPLVFNSGSRVTTDFRSQFHGVPGLVRERSAPTVTIHPDDAAKRGISHGDWALVRTMRGTQLFQAIVTKDIMQGVVDAAQGGGGPLGPEAWRNCNVNDLTDLENYDPISGFPVYKALMCQVVRAEKGGEETARLPVAGLEGVGASEAVSISPGMKKRLIYLDHNATTRMVDDARRAMEPYFDGAFGNPSSIHSPGLGAKQAVAAARRKVAALINCSARRLVFTAGGSEANNLAIKGSVYALRHKGRHLVTTAIEHPSVLLAFRWLEGEGYDVTYLTPDREGRVSPMYFKNALRPDTIFASVMCANNETGAIQPVKEIAHIAHGAGVRMHIDAVQAVGKVGLDATAFGADLMSLSGHKFHGPKGIGALYVREGVGLAPLVHGGKQESGLRAGTENVAGIVGIGAAAEIASRDLPVMEKVRRLRDRLEAGIRDILPEARRNGPETERLPNTLNMTMGAFRGESLALALDLKGVAVSPGSACRSGSPDPSHALLAMGLTEEEAHCSLRFSLGGENTEEEIDYTLEAIAATLKENAASVRFMPCR